MAQPPKRSNFEGPELGAQRKVTAGVSEVQILSLKLESVQMEQSRRWSCWGEQLSPPGLAPGPQSLTGVEEPGGLGGGLSRLSPPMMDEGATSIVSWPGERSGAQENTGSSGLEEDLELVLREVGGQIATGKGKDIDGSDMRQRRGGLGGLNGYPSGYGPRSGLGAGFDTGCGLGAQPGIGGVVKPQKLGVSPGFRNRNGLGVGAFPGTATQPGYGNGLGAGAFPGPGTQAGPAAQNGQGPGIGGSVKPQKPGLSSGNGLGAEPSQELEPSQDRALAMAWGPSQCLPESGLGCTLQTEPVNPDPAADPLGPVPKPGPPVFGTGNGAQLGLGGLKPQKPGFGASVRPQKPGFGNSNGLGAQPGSAVPIGYGPGIAEAMKPQKPVYRNALGVGAFPGEGPQPGLGGGLSPPKPGYMPGNGLQLPPGLGGGLKPQKPGYGNGNGLGAQPGYRPPNGYRPGAELGFGGGLKPQKVAIMYYALDHSGGQRWWDPVSGFPGADGFQNGELDPGDTMQGVGEGMSGAGQESAGSLAGYEGAAVVRPNVAAPAPGGNGPYGQLRPELGPGPLGGPEVKRGSNGLMGNGHGTRWLTAPIGWASRSAARGPLLEKQGLHGLCARGPGAAVVAKLAARLPRSRSHPRLARAHSRLGRARASLSLTPPPAPSLPHPPLPGLPPGLSPAPPPPPSALALAELPPLPALPLRPEPLAPWGPGAHVALPDLPPEAWASAPPAAALALQDLPRLPAPAPPPAHLPLPPLPETAVAATPGPVGARGRPPLNAEPPPQPLPPLPARPSPFNLPAPPAPRDPWPLPAFPPPLPLPPPPPHFFLSPPC
ncbi:collagen alpha-2(IV) chain-like [Balaenoptera musculus]|uniref:Collagen alpha-2(IV) chain-like n=1 Tax=Balaenoptera musculus TaxID=9771 RepID=A0A8B8VE14_BALMU|nr:collagen alpha-2(IV) chain-like [Balaenoptera musculus]